MFLHNEEGKICWKTNDMTGPFWNFSNPRAMDWFVEEIGGELTRESNINAVFCERRPVCLCSLCDSVPLFLSPSPSFRMQLNADAWACLLLTGISTSDSPSLPLLLQSTRQIGSTVGRFLTSKLAPTIRYGACG